MNKFFTILMLVLALSMTVVLADTHEANAGMTPDNPLWGLDVAFDKLSVALTTDDTKRAEKELRVAEERLSEIQEMVDEEKFDKSEKAQRAHAKVLERLERDIEKISSSDDEEQFQNEISIENRLRAHKENVDRFELRIEGDLNAEQQAALDALIVSLGDNVDRVEIKIRTKNDKTKIKLRESLSDDQIEELEGDRWEHLAQVTQAQAEREIARAEDKVIAFESRFADKLADANGEERPSRIARDALRTDDSDEDELDEDDDVDSDDEADEKEDEEDSTREDRSNSITGNVVIDQPVETTVVELDEDDDVDSDDETDAEDDADDSDEDEAESDDDMDDDESDDDEDESDDDSSDDNILRQFGLVLPEYDERGMHISQMFIDQAKEALATSYEQEDAGEYKAAYAYAKFAKKLANSAMKGKYLHLSDVQEDELDAIEDAREAEEDRLEDLEDAECAVDADCKSDEYCSEELECEDLDDVEEEEEELECMSDSDCDSDEYCDASGECEDLDDVEEDEEESDDEDDDMDSDDEEDDSDDDSDDDDE